MDFNQLIKDFGFPIGLSLLCGVLSALINLPWGIFWGWVLARKNFKGKVFVQTILYLPLVMPPVLTGYFLLMLLGRNSPVGNWLWENLGLSFVLDWKGAVLAAVVVGAPFMIETMRQAFLDVDERLELVARGLGAGFWRVFKTVTLPMARGGIIAGFFLVFARSIGEFGTTIMLAGNIPGRTQTIPLAIFANVYGGHHKALWPLVTAAILFAYAGLALSHFYRRKPHEGPR